MVRGRPPTEPSSPVRIFLMGANEWLDVTGWPAPGSAERAWYLDSEGHANSGYGDGRLCDRPASAQSPADAWVHDPDRPVPFITAASSAQIGGPDDYSGVDTRGDVLVYTSDPLSKPLDVVGPVRLVVFVSTTAGDTDITARLIDLHPNGFAQRLCDGLLRLRYRAGHEQAEPVEPDTVYEVEVVTWDTAHRILPGHCIRVDIASSAHPKFAVNLGTGGDESTATKAVVAHNRLYHDALRPSRLILTVLPGTVAESAAEITGA
ncbi:MAG: CocE/NonD family hydrolase [Solirubrobacterales bacterium]|nr:CocE/NonD family hydrolase [Solirubrobacterales bacterium]